MPEVPGNAIVTGPHPLMQPVRRVHWLIAAPIGLMVLASLMFVQSAQRKRADAEHVRALAAASTAHAAAPTGAGASIAVLPFTDTSGAHDEQYFSDGLTEELSGMLARTPGLRVTGRTSSFSFKGRDVDPRQVGRQLGVRAVLEGSARKSGDRIRVTAQLVDAADGTRLWSQAWDRGLDDVYAVQDEIADAVRTALAPRLPGTGAAASAAATQATLRTRNRAAYDQYLRALQTQARGTAESARARVDAFRKVVALDPGFAPAYAHLSVAESGAADYAGDAAGVAAAQRQALADAEKAIALAPSLSDGYWARGNHRANLGWDWQGARSDFEMALARNPNDTRVLQGYGALLASLGDLPGAIAVTQRAAERDPLLFSAWQALGYYQEGAGRLDVARGAQSRAAAMRPDFPSVQFRMGMLELEAKRPKPALALFDAITLPPLRLLGVAMAEHDMRHSSKSQLALHALLTGYGYNAAYQVAQAYAWRGQPDEAFQWLDRAFVQRDGGLAQVKYDPALRSLRKDPRYGVLLDKLGLPR